METKDIISKMSNWEKVKLIWGVERTEEIEKEILKCGWDYLWSNYHAQQRILCGYKK